MIASLLLLLLCLSASSPPLLQPVSAAQLLNLFVNSAGALTPAFAPGVYSYTASASSTTAALKFTAQNPGVVIQYVMEAGTAGVAPTTPSGAWITCTTGSCTTGYTVVSTPFTVAPLPATTVWNIFVRSPAGSADVYKVQVTRLSAEARLSSLVCTGDVLSPLTPSFSSDTYVYSYDASSAATSWSCVPVPMQVGASLSHSLDDGAWVAVASGSPAVRSMQVGDNKYSLLVVAQDERYSAEYTIIVHRKSPDAQLAALTPTVGSLNPAFDPSTRVYTLTLQSGASSIKFTPAFSYTGTKRASIAPATTCTWTFRGGGASATLHEASTPDLDVVVDVPNVLEFTVRAEDGINVLVYRVSITRISSSTLLGSLLATPNPTGFVPSFPHAEREHFMAVPNGQTGVVFSFSPASPGATATWSTNANAPTVPYSTGVTSSTSVTLPVGDTFFLVHVIAEDRVSKGTYTIRVRRRSKESTLASLVTSTALAAPFQPSVLRYDLTVGVNTQSFYLTAWPTYESATMHTSLNGGAWVALAAGTPSAAFSLATGDNVVRVRVTSEDTSSVTPYELHVYLQSSLCFLTSLSTTPPGFGLVPGPPFDPSVTEYTLRVPDSVASLRVTSAPSPHASQQYQLENDPLESLAAGVPSDPIDLRWGNNTIRIRVLAEDALSHRVYTLVVHRVWSSVKLQSLTTDLIMDAPFAPNQLAYNITVQPTVSSITLRAVAENPLALLSYSVHSGAFQPAVVGGVLSLGPLALATADATDTVYVGNTIVRIRVESEDGPGSFNSVYSVRVHRISATATLAALDPSPAGGGLVPAFQTDIEEYTLRQEASATSLSLQPVLSYPRASFQYRLGDAPWSVVYTSATASSPAILLPYGNSTLLLRVTAEDGLTRRTTRIIVHRLSSLSALSSLTAGSVPLNPLFDPSRTEYSMVVSNQTHAVSVTPTAGYALAALSYSFNEGAWVRTASGVGVSPALQLVAGNNTVRVQVVSEDGSSTTVYALSIRRISPASSLASLITSPLGQGLAPDFSSAVFDYALSFPAAVDRFNVRAVLSYPSARMKMLYGDVLVQPDLGSNALSVPLDLQVGLQRVTLVVQAEDGITTSTYRIAVRRLSDDARLGALSTSASLTTPFSPDQFEYDVDLGSATHSLTVSSTLLWERATQEVSFSPAAFVPTPSPQDSTFAMDFGDSVVQIRVRSEDTDVLNVYILRIHRPSNDATLSALAINPAGSGLDFDPLRLNYSLRFFASVESVTLTSSVSYTPVPGAVQSYARGDEPYTTLPSGATTPPLELFPGPNRLSINVVAEDDVVQRVYQLFLHRESADTSLAQLHCSVSLWPPFEPSRTEYAMNVSSGVGSVWMRATLSNPFASLWLDATSNEADGGGAYVPLASGVQSGLLVLPVGDHTILLKIVGEGGSSTLSTVYRVKIHRISMVISLRSLSSLPDLGLSPPFTESSPDSVYSLILPGAQSILQWLPVTSDLYAEISWSLNGSPYLPMSSGVLSPPIDIPYGAAVFQLKVLAEDRITQRVYRLNVRRMSDDSSLASLVSSLTLVPSFVPGTFDYTVRVATSVSTASFAPRPSSPYASVQLGLNAAPWVAVDHSAGAGASLTVPLDFGTNLVLFRVQPEDVDGGVASVYSVEVYRLSSNTLLAALSLDPVPNDAPYRQALEPFFQESVQDYSFALLETDAPPSLSTRTADPTARTQWSLNDAGWSAPSTWMMSTLPLDLALGDSVLRVKVLAENGFAHATTTVRVRKMASNPAIPSLTSSAPMDPSFEPEVLEYVVRLDAHTDRLTLHLALMSAWSSVQWALVQPLEEWTPGSLVWHDLSVTQVLKTNEATGVLTIPVEAGNSTLMLWTRAEDTVLRRLYSFRVHRLSNDTSLSILTLPALTPALASNVFEHISRVPYDTESLQFSSCARYHPHASVWLYSALLGLARSPLPCGSSLTLPTPAGSQWLFFEIQAEDGTTRNTTVHVRRVDHSAEVTLFESVQPTDGSVTLVTPLSPAWNSTSLPEQAYEVHVSNALTTIQLRMVQAHPSATTTYTLHTQSLGAENTVSTELVAPHNRSFTVPVAMGNTLMRMRTTSEDGLVWRQVDIFLRRSPFAFSQLPSYLLSSARYHFRLLPSFGPAPFRIVSLRLPSIPRGGVVVSGAQSALDESTPLLFSFDAPPEPGPCEIRLVALSNSGGFVAPPPVIIPVMDGSWFVRLAPNTANSGEHAYVHQLVRLDLAPTEPVDGVITVSVASALVDGTPFALTTETAGMLSFAPRSVAPQTLFVRMPSAPGTVTLRFTVTGFYPVPDVLLTVESRATFSVSTPPPEVMLIANSYSLALAPSAGPRLPNVSLTVRASRGSVGTTFAPSTTLEWAQGDVAPKTLLFTAPSTRGNFTLSFSYGGTDHAHYAPLSPMLLFAFDGCDATNCGPHAHACVPQGGVTFVCICNLGWTGTLCDEALYTGVPAGAPRAPAPVALLDGPTIVSPCDTLRLDGSRSFGLGSLSSDRVFSWTLAKVYKEGATSTEQNSPSSVPYSVQTQVTSPTTLSFLLQRVANGSIESIRAEAPARTAGDLSTLLIPATQLSAGWTYLFALRVGNFYSVSPPVFLAVTVSADRTPWAPQVSILSPPLLYAEQAASFRAVLLPSSCEAGKNIPLDTVISYAWEVRRAGAAVTPATNLVKDHPTASTGVLSLPAGFLRPGIGYTVALSTEVTSGGSSATGFGSRRRMLEVITQSSASNIGVTVARSPLRLSIYGAMIRQRPANRPIVLDASDSWDPERAVKPLNASIPAPPLAWLWSCTIGRMSVPAANTGVPCPFAGTAPDLTASVLTVPADGLAASQWYSFSVTLSEATSGRTASAFVEVYVDVPPSNGKFVSVSIVDALPLVSALAPLRLQGTAVSSSGAAPETFTYRWSSVPHIDMNGDGSSPLLSQPDTNLLVLASGALQGHAQVTFTLTVCSPADAACSTASTVVGVAPAPTGGSLLYSPLYGTGLSTPFTLRADGFVDPYQQDPFLYVFSYVDESLPRAQQEEHFLTAPSSAPSVTLMLPPGRLRLRVYVVNQQGATAVADAVDVALVALAPAFLASAETYASNATTLLLPAVLEQGDPARSLDVLQQLAALSNVLTSRTLARIQAEVDQLTVAHGVPPAELTTNAVSWLIQDAGFAIRKRLWTQLPAALGWSVKNGVVQVPTTEALDPVLAHQALRVIQSLTMHASPSTVASRGHVPAIPSMLSLSSPMLTALVSTLPGIVSGDGAVRNVTAHALTDGPVPSSILFRAGVLRRQSLFDMAFSAISRSVANCTDLEAGKSMLLALASRESRGTWVGEEVAHPSSSSSSSSAAASDALIQFFSKRSRSPHMGSAGDGSTSSSGQAGGIRDTHVGIFPYAPLYHSVQGRLEQSQAMAGGSLDAVASHPRSHLFLDTTTLRFARAPFAHCRATADYFGRLSVLSSDITVARMQMAMGGGSGGTILPVTPQLTSANGTAIPPALDVALPFDASFYKEALPYIPLDCGDTFVRGEDDAPVVRGLSCALWSASDNMYWPPTACVPLVTPQANSSSITCACGQLGEYGVIYQRDPNLDPSAPCEAERGSTWLLVVGSMYGALWVGLAAAASLIVNRWHRFAAKQQFGLLWLMVMFVAVTRGVFLLTTWLSPTLTEARAITMQLMAFLIVHWVGLSAAYHWCLTFNALRTMHMRVHASATSFRPSWSRAPFLPLCLLALAYTVGGLIFIFFAQGDESPALLYRVVLYMHSLFSFGLCIGALASLLPSTRNVAPLSLGGGGDDVAPFSVLQDFLDSEAEAQAETEWHLQQYRKRQLDAAMAAARRGVGEAHNTVVRIEPSSRGGGGDRQMTPPGATESQEDGSQMLPLPASSSNPGSSRSGGVDSLLGQHPPHLMLDEGKDSHRISSPSGGHDGALTDRDRPELIITSEMLDLPAAHSSTSAEPDPVLEPSTATDFALESTLAEVDKYTQAIPAAPWMLIISNSPVVRRERLAMKVLPFLAATVWGGQAILAFVAASNAWSMLGLDRDGAGEGSAVGLPFYVLEVIQMALLLSFGLYSSHLSALELNYPYPSESATGSSLSSGLESGPVARKQWKSMWKDAGSSVVHSRVSALEAALAAAHATSAAQRAAAAGGQVSQGRLAFEVAQAIFAQQQEQMAMYGPADDGRSHRRSSSSASKKRTSKRSGSTATASTTAPAPATAPTPATATVAPTVTADSRTGQVVSLPPIVVKHDPHPLPPAVPPPPPPPAPVLESSFAPELDLAAPLQFAHSLDQSYSPTLVSARSPHQRSRRLQGPGQGQGQGGVAAVPGARNMVAEAIALEKKRREQGWK